MGRAIAAVSEAAGAGGAGGTGGGGGATLPVTLTIMAWLPPFRKKSRTENPRWESFDKPPKVRSKSAKLLIVVGSLAGPRSASPTNAAIEVATPVIVWTPLAISST